MTDSFNDEFGTFYKGVTFHAQFTIFWLPFDKYRPGLVISNDWYNCVTGHALVAPITSRDKSFSDSPREYAELYIPFVCGTSSDEKENIVSYIDMGSIRVFGRNAFKRKSSLGVLTDGDVRASVCNIMNNVVRPNYNSMHTSFTYQLKHRCGVTSLTNIQSMIECADVPDNVLNYGIPNEECCIVNELKGDVSDNGQNNDIEETLDEQVEQLVSKYRTPIRKDTFINLCREIEYNEFVKHDVYELATVTSLSDVENANDKVINALAYMVVTRPSNRISILNTSYIGRKFLDMLLEYDMEHALVSSVLHEAINKFSHRQGNRITFEKFIKKFYK